MDDAAKMIQLRLSRRIRRAAALSAAYPYAAQVLQFYKHIAQFQESITHSFTRDSDIHSLLRRFSAFLRVMEEQGPSALAHSAGRLRTREDQWEDLLNRYWNSDSDSDCRQANMEAVLAWIFLQPFAEYVAAHSKSQNSNQSQGLCPSCSRKPHVGVLRSEGDGAKRSLICSFCSTEWAYGRIGCPACGEENVEKLAIYTAEQFEHVRIEACETCRRYLKTIDLVRNGLADPVVDELATIPLNLWAQEQGYTKVQSNLLGI